MNILISVEERFSMLILELNFLNNQPDDILIFFKNRKKVEISKFYDMGLQRYRIGYFKKNLNQNLNMWRSVGSDIILWRSVGSDIILWGHFPKILESYHVGLKIEVAGSKLNDKNFF